jgi:hypothetical protein
MHVNASKPFSRIIGYRFKKGYNQALCIYGSTAFNLYKPHRGGCCAGGRGGDIDTDCGDIALEEPKPPDANTP